MLAQPSGHVLAVDVADSGDDPEEVCTAMLEHEIVSRPGATTRCGEVLR